MSTIGPVGRRAIVFRRRGPAPDSRRRRRTLKQVPLVRIARPSLPCAPSWQLHESGHEPGRLFGGRSGLTPWSIKNAMDMTPSGVAARFEIAGLASPLRDSELGSRGVDKRSHVGVPNNSPHHAAHRRFGPRADRQPQRTVDRPAAERRDLLFRARRRRPPDRHQSGVRIADRRRDRAPSSSHRRRGPCDPGLRRRRGVSSHRRR